MTSPKPGLRERVEKLVLSCLKTSDMVDAILQSIIDVVPQEEEIKTLGYIVGISISQTVSDIEQAKGWNACRNEMLKRLGEK